MLVSVVAIGCSCNDDETYTEEGEIVIGGEDVGTKDGEVVFYKADDLHVTLSATKDTLNNSAYVYENGLKVGVDVDVSGVTFGTAGEYPIVYRYGNSFVEKKIYIYGAPSITGEATVSVAFSKATLGVFEGLSAKDHFANALDLQIVDDGGMIDLDGSYNVGTFTVKMVAVDKAGQIAEFTRSITITEEKNPVVTGTHAFDVNEESFSFTLDAADSANFVGVSFNGTGVPAEYLAISNNTFTIDNEFFYNYLLKDSLVNDLENGDKYVMSVLTSKGKTKTEFTLNDKQDIVYDLSPVTEFAYEYFPCFVDTKVEKISLLNKYQRVTPVYKIIQGSSEITLPNNNANFPKDGTWKLEIDLRGKKVYADIETYYDLGYKNGTIYSPANPFKNNLPDGFSLLEFEVRDNSDGKKVAYLDDANELNAFVTAVNALSAKEVYNLTVKAIKDGTVYTQTTFFSVVKDGVSILGDDTDAGNMIVNEDAFTYLDYTQKLVGGRRGVYRWGGKQEYTYSDKSKISFAESVRSEMKKDYYISFDVYYTREVVMIANMGKGFSYYTWGPATIYGSMAEHNAAEAGNAHSSDTVYCGDIIKFFDATGNQIIRDKNGYDPMRNYRNQWITVQLKIEADSIPDTAGFHIYTQNSRIDNQEVYFSNFKVSSVPSMEDATENPVIKDLGDIEFEDIWK